MKNFVIAPKRISLRLSRWRGAQGSSPWKQELMLTFSQVITVLIYLLADIFHISTAAIVFFSF